MKQRIALIAAVLLIIAAYLFFTQKPVNGSAEAAGAKEEVPEMLLVVYQPEFPPLFFSSGGLAYVQSNVKRALTSGINEIRFPNLPNRIISDSIFLEAEGEVKEQRLIPRREGFELLGGYLGKAVISVNRSIKGKLVAFGDGLFIETDSELVHLRSYDELRGARGEALRASPEAVFLLDSKGGEEKLSLSYLVNGISWDAEYVLTLSEADDAKADLSGLAGVANGAGFDIQNAKVVLIAGDVQRIGGYYYPYPAYARPEAAIGAAAPSGLPASEAFEFKQYDLPRRMNIKDGELVQVPFVESKGIGITKKYVLESGSSGVQTQIVLENKKEKGLGISLPRGKIRALSKGVFVGEASFLDLAEGENATLDLGKAFDLSAERESISRKVTKCTVTEKSAVTLRNAKEKDVIVEVHQSISEEIELLEESAMHKKKTADEIVWDIPVPAKGKAVLTYTLKTRYSGCSEPIFG